MAKHRLKVTLTDRPQPDGVVSTRRVSVRQRLARRLLGKKQELTVLVPGSQLRSVEIVRSDDDLTALAKAAGALRGGDTR